MPSLWVAPSLPRVQPLPFSPATSHSSAKKPLHGSPHLLSRNARLALRGRQWVQERLELFEHWLPWRSKCSTTPPSTAQRPQSFREKHMVVGLGLYSQPGPSQAEGP